MANLRKLVATVKAVVVGFSDIKYLRLDTLLPCLHLHPFGFVYLAVETSKERFIFEQLDGISCFVEVRVMSKVTLPQML